MYRSDVWSEKKEGKYVKNVQKELQLKREVLDKIVLLVKKWKKFMRKDSHHYHFISNQTLNKKMFVSISILNLE